MTTESTEVLELDLNREIAVITTTNDDNTLNLDNTPYVLPLRVASFSSEKDLDHFIKNVEKLVRCSLEYRLWVSYVTESLGHNKCALTHEKLSECGLAVHHHPIPLYFIVKMVVNMFMSLEQKFCSYDIATKVMELHFQNKIGYQILLQSIHEKFHNGFQKLPVEYCHGNYKHLLEHYTLSEDELRSITCECNTHLDDCKINWEKDNYPGLKQN